MKTIFLVLLCVSCSSIQTSKYEAFFTSVKKFNQSIETSTFEARKAARSRGIARFASAPNSRPSDLFITAHGYGWNIDNPPVYLKLIKVEDQLKSMNDLFYDYASLLYQIAGNEIEKDELKTLILELNKKSSHLTETLEVNASKESVSILSTITVGSLQAFIDSKKEKLLLKAIRKNQSVVESFVKMSIDLIQILNELSIEAYNEDYYRFSKKWKTVSEKELIAKDMFDLNDALLSNLEHYQNLEEAYSDLPLVHALLAKKNSPKNFNAKLKSLVDSGNKLMQLHKDPLKKEGSK